MLMRVNCCMPNGIRGHAPRLSCEHPTPLSLGFVAVPRAETCSRRAPSCSSRRPRRPGASRPRSRVATADPPGDEQTHVAKQALG
eukprot:4886940-Pleurochrysis_carterae.AAC.1